MLRMRRGSPWSRRATRGFGVLTLTTLWIGGCGQPPVQATAAPALAAAAQPPTVLVRIDDAEALKQHIQRPKGLLFIDESWSLPSQEVRLRLGALSDSGGGQLPSNLSLAYVQLHSLNEPQWLFGFLEEHRVQSMTNAPLVSYAKGDGALVWSSGGRVVDVAALPASMADALIVERSRR